MELKSIDNIMPNSAKQGFYVGAMIGAVAWIIGSPLFGKLLGNYTTGDVFGKIVGAVLIGLFTYCLIKQEFGKILKITTALVTTIVAYIVVHEGGFTIVFKGFVDSFIPDTRDNTWAFSFMLSYGVMGFLVGGLTEAIQYFFGVTE